MALAPPCEHWQLDTGNPGKESRSCLAGGTQERESSPSARSSCAPGMRRPASSLAFVRVLARILRHARIKHARRVSGSLASAGKRRRSVDKEGNRTRGSSRAANFRHTRKLRVGTAAKIGSSSHAKEQTQLPGDGIR